MMTTQEAVVQKLLVLVLVLVEMAAVMQKLLDLVLVLVQKLLVLLLVLVMMLMEVVLVLREVMLKVRMAMPPVAKLVVGLLFEPRLAQPCSAQPQLSHFGLLAWLLAQLQRH